MKEKEFNKAIKDGKQIRTRQKAVSRLSLEIVLKQFIDEE